jgi:hypothetical protein
VAIVRDSPINADGYARSANGVSIAASQYVARRVEHQQSRSSLAELKVSLTVHLYPVCFTIDSSPIAYPYAEPYLQFIRALDSRRLTPDVLDVLKDCIFVDGCVAVEINDLRDARPCNHRVLLRPQYDVIVRDAAASSISSDHDLLQVERHMLLAASKPLCLAPDPAVFFVTSLINYCERRVELLPKQIPQVLDSAALVKPQKFSLHSFLLMRNGGRKVTFRGSGQGIPMFNVPAVAEKEIVQPFILPNFQDSVNGKRAPLNFELFYNREVAFDRPPARKVFFCIRITQQKGGPRVYHGVFRVGTSPDTGSNGHKTMFALGSRERATLFLEHLLLTFQREGYVKTVVSQQQQAQSQPPAAASAPPQPMVSAASTPSSSAPVPPTTIRSRSSLNTSTTAAPIGPAKKK